jgi:hypothetical protein
MEPYAWPSFRVISGDRHPRKSHFLNPVRLAAIGQNPAKSSQIGFLPIFAFFKRE